MAQRRGESGEPVEGAFSGILVELVDSPLGSLADVIDIFEDYEPDNAYEFIEGWVDSGRNPTTLFRIYQKHGIVYSRALFKLDPFNVGPPTLTELPGNKIVKDDYTILRGNVPVEFEAAPKTKLGVDKTFAIEEVLLYAKAEWLSFAESAAGFPDLPLSEAEFSEGSVPFPTADLDDGDYELLLGNENDVGFVDVFLRKWLGDSNGEVDTEEKAHRRMGSWYDGDRDHQSPVGKEVEDGMVVIDNTPPDVTSFFPPRRRLNAIQRLRRFLQRLHRDERGAVSLETVLIVGAIALPILIYLIKVGWPTIRAMFDENLHETKVESDRIKTGSHR